MKKYGIMMLKSYQRDVQSIVNYLKKHESEHIAEMQAKRIYEASFKLEYFPERGSPNDTSKAKITRFIIVDRYKIYYVVHKNHVSLQRVIHMKRNFKI
ncbi:MAG: type II toxin-antitoxin system RelE/ParE family toxin [Defluviitaleaceae bacterium]|nr:type II toxin-antitoxin system RelE/ParE family toxin [Defluviitaleaceae bacterium]